MNRYEEHDHPERSNLDRELREVLGSAAQADFDIDALIVGTKMRAGRIRRRRALAQGVTAVALVPALVGAGWLIGHNLEGPGEGPLDLAGGTEVVTERTSDDAVATSTATTTDEAVQTTAGGPPWQSVEPDPVDPDPGGSIHVNRVEIPDARPTGIPFLDALSAEHVMHYPRVSPLSTYVGQLGEGGTELTGIEAHSGTEWMYFDGSNRLDQETVHLTITAWDDSMEAMQAIRTDEPTDYSWVWLEPDPSPTDPDDVGLVRGVPDPLAWPGHVGDEDYLLVETPEGGLGGMKMAGALVRQGDYLVGVEVRAATVGEARAAAAEIAEKTAANLAYLDPERGQD